MTALRPLRIPQPELAPEATPGTDLLILVPTLLLVGLGVAMVFSASIPMAAAMQSDDVFHYLRRELVFAVTGVLAMLLVSRLPMSAIRRQAGTILFVALALLGLVLVVGVEVNGARRWLPVPGTGMRFQPSEFARLALVIAAARYFARFPFGIPNWRRALPPFAMLGATVLLVVVEPDMGMALLIVAAMLVYYHIAGMKFRHVAAFAWIGLVGAALMVIRNPYQLGRITGWVDRSELASDEGYQVTQCLIALGSGGLTGRGYCGSVWKYFYLPEAITDAILPIIGEELGLLATWMVVGLLAVLVWRGMTIAGRARDRFTGLVAAGAACIIAVPAMMNIAVVTHSMPATGVPLPFVSYGGSSLICSLIGVGLLLNAARAGARPEAASAAEAI